MEYLQRIAVALAVGLLIGIERGWRDRDYADGKRVAGVRTFALVALLGALWGLLANELGAVLLGFGFVAFTALVIVAHLLDVRRNQDYGITTSAASLVTFVIGALAAQGQLTLAAAAGVVTAVLLSLKPLLISVVLLPVLPDRGYGPWQALNPYEIWAFIVLIAALSFTGYFAIKFGGARLGVVFTGLFGGFASSTAIALTFARLLRDNPTARALLAAGIVVAAGTMFPRMLLEVALVNPALLPRLSGPLLAMAVSCYLAVPLLLYHASRAPLGSEIRLHNPFELGPALKFGLLLVGVLVAAHGLQQWLGSGGVYLLAAVAALADVDAITLTMARQSRDTIEPQVASHAILLAALVNTMVKGGIVLQLARRAAWPVAATFAVALGAGALVFVLQ